MMRESYAALAEQMPSHEEFIARTCSASVQSAA